MMYVNDRVYIDFEDVVEGSIFVVEESGMMIDNVTLDLIERVVDDMWVVERGRGRPRTVNARNLRTSERMWIRVDKLLELDDDGYIKIGPGRCS